MFDWVAVCHTLSTDNFNQCCLTSSIIIVLNRLMHLVYSVRWHFLSTPLHIRTLIIYLSSLMSLSQRFACQYRSARFKYFDCRNTINTKLVFYLKNPRPTYRIILHMVVLNNALKAYTSNPYAKFIRESALHASLWRLLSISLLRHMSVIVVKPTAT